MHSSLGPGVRSGAAFIYTVAEKSQARRVACDSVRFQIGASWGSITVKKLFIAAALATLITAPAMAADMAPRPAPVYRPPPPVVPVWSWTGCYFGGHVGGVWSTKDWTDNTPGFVTF